MMRVILLGAPGSGKGTQAKSIESKYPIAHISTGDILRANIKADTELGRTAKDYMDHGKLVPDELIFGMMAQRFAEADCQEGFLLDGFPRNIRQAKALDKKLESLGIKLDAVVYLKIDDETVLQRLTSRRVCRHCGAIYNVISHPTKVDGVCDKCGGEVIQRRDDTEEVIRHRLEVSHEQTGPLVGYYEKQGLLITVDANGGKDAVLKVLEAR